jgi:hypothetical protein
MSSRSPRLRFAALCVVMTALGIGYALRSVLDSADRPAEASENERHDIATLIAIQQRPHLLFITDGRAPSPGRVALVASDAPGGPRYVSDLRCERVHFAAGRGVCLTLAHHAVYEAYVFDETFAILHQIALPGVPSRVRLSPDGRRAGITVFVRGDSYTSTEFSTRTLIIDVAEGRVLGQLEEYDVRRDARPFKARDFNFWGVTFVDGRRFYSTLGTGGRTYLVEGDVDTRQLRVVYSDGECPALSPDGTRLAFKRRDTTPNRVIFQLHVLDLRTMTDTTLAERRSADDQPEWLDTASVVYGLPGDRPGATNVWAVSADGTKSPQRLIQGAWSPASVIPQPDTHTQSHVVLQRKGVFQRHHHA